MTDTVRTLTALQTLLADNTGGAISPQDLRDMMVSLASPLLALYEKGWKDSVALVASAPNGAVAPTMADFGPAGTLQRRELSFAVNDYVFIGAFHTNHDVSAGCKCYPHVHWSTNGTSTATVKWEFHIQRAKGHNQAAFGAPAVISVTQAGSGTAWKHMIAECADVDALTLSEPDELILVTLRRVTNGGAENGDTVFGLMLDLHYEADRQSTLNKAPNFYA